MMVGGRRKRRSPSVFLTPSLRPAECLPTPIVLDSKKAEMAFYKLLTDPMVQVTSDHNAPAIALKLPFVDHSTLALLTASQSAISILTLLSIIHEPVRSHISTVRFITLVLFSSYITIVT
jgi:hypothetical protein